MGIDHDDSGSIAIPGDWTSRDTAILASLVIAGLVYFGQYYDCGFNVGDEGSAVLISARLLDGERPFTDVVLGYGLLWFYPLVLLFKITGVSFIATRIYFLSLALMTSLLAYATVRRHSSRRGLAAAVALLALAMPGTLHKTYIPLIVIANMLCLPSLDRRRTLAGQQVFGAGLVAAVSYHIRPDLGLVAALVLVLTLAAHALSREPSWPARIRRLGRLWMLFCVAALVPSLPLFFVAHSQGFLELYLELLYQPVQFLSESMAPVAAILAGVARTLFLTPVAWAAEAADGQALAAVGKTLARTPWDAVWQAGPQRSFAVLTFLPLLSLALVAAFAVFRMLRRGLEGRPAVADDSAGILGLVGLTGSAFPQFFLFRPDVAHLSQFMLGYMVLIGVVFGRWLLPARGAVRARSPTAARKQRLSLLTRSTAAGLLILHVSFYTWFAFPRPVTGSIALARGRTERFHGAGGVDIAVRPDNREYLSRVARVVEDNSGGDDVVLCFPYCPGVNVMTGRRTFTRRLYFDDGMLKLEPDWQQRTIDRIKTNRVPLIIIRDWAPNGTEISRFKNWASEVMDHLAACYQLTDDFGLTSFYRRVSVAEFDPPALGSVPSDRQKACLDLTEAMTDTYLRTLDVAEFARRGSDFASPLFDPQRVAAQLGKKVDELVGGRDYDFERLEAIERRLKRVDRQRVLAKIFEQVTGGARSNTEKHIALADFLAKAFIQGPLTPTYRESFLGDIADRHPAMLRVEDPLVLLELGEGESSRVAAVAVDLWRAAGMEARRVKLGRSFAAELHYDEGWHYLDVTSLGGAEMVRMPDGTVPSLAELSRTPLAIDRSPSYVEPKFGGRVLAGSPHYLSYRYFGTCPDCAASTYTYKIGSRHQQALDLYFGWQPPLIRWEQATDIALSSLPERFQPGAPWLLGVDVGTPEEGTVTVAIRWQSSIDKDGDVLGYRVFVSRESRGWSYEPAGAPPEVLPYWSHPDGWQPSMYDRLFELPKSDVTLVTTEVEQVWLTLEPGHTYFVTVMPFDAHGEAVGRKLYRASQELKISL